jgi:hypothetical protein
MRRIPTAPLTGIVFLAAMIPGNAADCGCGHVSCSGSASCPVCVPACKATWGEAKTRKPRYSMEFEYACVRDRAPWRSPPTECRCSPPCGKVIVKKRLYKADGTEGVERVPKYEVEMVPVEPCHCSSCTGRSPLCWWNPAHWIAALLGD